MNALPRLARTLWQCVLCGRFFANRNQPHSCRALELTHHFEGKAPAVRELFERFLAALRALGPVTVLPERSRIAFQTRMSFAQLTPRKAHLVGHLVLAKSTPSAKFTRIESLSPRNHVHHFRLESAEFIDAEFLAMLAQAYAVGNQDHLGAPGARIRQ